MIHLSRRVRPFRRGRLLGWLAWLRFLAGRVEAPEHAAPWPPFAMSVPADLRTYAGEARDRDAERQAAEERPLHEFFTLHPEASEALVAHGRGYLVPTLPRLADAVHRLRRATRRRPARTVTPLDGPTLTAALRDHAHALGVSRIGIAEADPMYTFAETDSEQLPMVVVCLVEQDWELTQRIPSDEAEQAAMHAYVEGMNRTAEIATFLKRLGYRAAPQGFTGDGVAIHYGVQAGLGQLGLNGQLLTPEAGSRCRILLLTTDAPIVCDEPVDHGLHTVCDECRACVRNCPVGAIPQTRKPYRGVVKAKLNTARCLPLVVQASGCGICMKVCPVQRYGLRAVIEHRERTGTILGVGSDELEGYDWPLDGRHYGPGDTPAVEASVLRQVPFDATRRDPPDGVEPIRFVGGSARLRADAPGAAMSRRPCSASTTASSRWLVGGRIGDLTGRTSAEPATGGAGTIMSVDGVDLHVRADGPVDGPAFLMLHGFGASTAWFDQVVARLPECRIIRVDLLGHGGSARPTSGYDPDSQGRLYARLLSDLDLNDVTVVGHSMGSLFGVATAEHSTRITRLVLIGEGPDTSTGTLPSGEWVIHIPWIGPMLQQHGPAFVTSRVVRRAFAPGFDGATAFANPSQGLDDARSLSHPAFTQSMRRRQAWTRRLGLDARLDDLALPALVIFGREDRFYDVDASLARYRAVRTITTAVLEHVGHTPMIEAPDRVADLIREFLSTGEKPLGAPREVADSKKQP